MNTNRWIWNNSNIHNNTSAGTVLHTIKGGKDGRPAVEQLVAIHRRSLTSDDSRTGVQRTKTVQSTTQRLQRLLSFRTSPQGGLHNRTTSPTLSYSCFVANSHDHLRVSTDVTQRCRDDNLHLTRLSTSPLQQTTLSSPLLAKDNFNIVVSKVSRSLRWLQTSSQHQRFKFPNSVAISVQLSTVNSDNK